MISLTKFIRLQHGKQKTRTSNINQVQEDFDNSYLTKITEAQCLINQSGPISNTSQSTSQAQDGPESEGNKDSNNDKINLTVVSINSEKNESLCKRHYVKKQIKLLDIKVSLFNGTYEYWIEYRNTFRSLIHENDDLLSEIKNSITCALLLRNRRTSYSIF